MSLLSNTQTLYNNKKIKTPKILAPRTLKPKKLQTTILLTLLIFSSSSVLADNNQKPLTMLDIIQRNNTTEEPTLEEVQLRNFETNTQPISNINVAEVSTALGYGNMQYAQEQAEKNNQINQSIETSEIEIIDEIATLKATEHTNNLNNNTKLLKDIEQESRAQAQNEIDNYDNDEQNNPHISNKDITDETNKIAKNNTLNVNDNTFENTDTISPNDNSEDELNVPVSTEKDNIEDLIEKLEIDAQSNELNDIEDSKKAAEISAIDRKKAAEALLSNARKHSQIPTQSTQNNSLPNIPAFRSLMNQGVNELKDNKLDLAENTFTKAQRIIPQSSAVYFYLGQIALKKNQAIKAEAFGRRGLVVSDSDSRRQLLWKLILESAKIQNNKNTITEAKKALQ